MNIKYVWINEEVMDDFKVIMPWELIVDADNICLAAMDDDDNIMGVICYGSADYQVDILWLYVIPKYRRQKIATLLLDKMRELLIKSGQVYPITARFQGDDEQLYLFFLSYEGMEVTYSHERYVLKPNDIYKGRYPMITGKESLKEVKFFDLPKAVQQNILRMLTDEEGFVTGDYEEWKRDLVPELCRCIMRNDELLSLIFIHRLSEKELELSYLYSINPVALGEIIAGAAADIEQYYPDCKLIFDAVNDKAAAIAKKIYPKIKSVPVYEAELI